MRKIITTNNKTTKNIALKTYGIYAEYIAKEVINFSAFGDCDIIQEENEEKRNV